MNQTLTQKLEIFLLEKEKIGYEVSNLSNTAIVLLYYSYLGITSTTTMQEWLTRVADGVVPPYPSITRSIRKCRELNPRWKKETHQKKREVKNAKKKIGYSNKRSEREGEK